MGLNEVVMTQKEEIVEVDLKQLPSFTKLNEKVQKIVKTSTKWELYGVDICKALIATAFVPLALMLLKSGGILPTVLGTLILAYFHMVITVKCGHASTHGAIWDVSPATVRAMTALFIEFCGSYSSYMSSYIHIDIHHPYTNIIGLGDSSAFKAPFLNRELYLFVMPLFLPVITPLVATYQLLVEQKLYREVLKFIPVLFGGWALTIYLLMTYSDFSFISSIIFIIIYRGIFSIPYIHLNIFQHIGLPMYSPKSKPKSRIYQMSTGVLNLSRNPFLDIVFGHSLINCHVEHHLFPKLSDNMCLKIKPVVSEYLKTNGLCYHEDSYMNRLIDFYVNYEKLMVHAPPITHFVGI